MNKSKTNAIALTIIFISVFAGVPRINAGFSESVNIEIENSQFLAPADCEQTKKLANEIVDKLVAQDFEGVRKNFNENLTKNLSAEQLKTVWTSVIKEIGEYKSREKSLYQEFSAETIVFTRLQMQTGRVSVEVHFGDDGKIIGLWLRPA